MAKHIVFRLGMEIMTGNDIENMEMEIMTGNYMENQSE